MQYFVAFVLAWLSILPRAIATALVLSLPAHALTPPTADVRPAVVPPAVVLSGHEAQRPLAAHTQTLEDAGRTLDLAGVLSPAAAWKPHHGDTLRFEFSDSAWWFRLTLANGSGKPQEFVLDLNSPRQDHVRWVVRRPDGKVLLNHATGDRMPRDTRLINSRGMAMPLHLATGEQVEVYVRLQSHDGASDPISLNISQRDTHFQHLRGVDILLSLYLGALLALSIYNLFLYLSTRQIEYAAYVAYLAAMLMWNAAYLGYSFEYLLPGNPALNHQLILGSAGVAYASFAWFVIAYLKLDANSPHRLAAKFFRAAIVLNLLPVGLAFSDHYLAAGLASVLPGLGTMIGTLVFSVKLSLQGRRDARFLSIATFTLVCSVVIFNLGAVGVVRAAGLTQYCVQIGHLIEVLLLAFGLADSMNTLKTQKLNAERAASEAQRALNDDLEQQVRDRTRALEKANHLLGELAITDELTGAYNRRHFNRYCVEMLQHPSRDEPLALCMFDIDHFKRYNDRYGHQAGDAVLRDVSHAVRSALRRSGDHLFRLGGEEFGVLFTARSNEAARAFAGSLHQAVRDLACPHADNPPGIVTASFGVAWWAPASSTQLTLRRMYTAADAALYEAKGQGRDRVVLSTSAPIETAPAPLSQEPAAVG